MTGVGPAIATVAVEPDALAGLFAFQREGVDRLLSAPGVLLADEMGLGKTIQAIAALRILKQRGALRQALVVTPAGLILQWRRQLRQWAPELKLSTVVGVATERMSAWAAHADVYLASYETIRGDATTRSQAGPAQRMWDIIALDEAQRIKNAASAGASAVKRLRRHRSWALTGTPVENRLDDLLSILDFVAPGQFDPRRRAIGLRQLLAEVQLRPPPPRRLE